MSTKRLPKGLSIKMGHPVSNNPALVATLYQTEIVIIYPDSNRIILRTGGWFTSHTKKCMNLILADYRINVRQIKGKWYVFQFDTKNVNGAGPDGLRHDAILFQNDTLEVTLD